MSSTRTCRRLSPADIPARKAARSGSHRCPNSHACASSVQRRIGGWSGVPTEARDHAHPPERPRQRIGAAPEASRLDETDSALALRAALSGRLDITGPAGLAGLQRVVGNARAAELVDEERSPVHDVVASAGTPLPTDVRTDMEGRFGQDFGGRPRPPRRSSPRIGEIRERAGVHRGLGHRLPGRQV